MRSTGRARVELGGRTEAVAWLLSLVLLAAGVVLSLSLLFATPAQAASAPTASGESPSIGLLTVEVGGVFDDTIPRTWPPVVVSG